MSRCIALVLLPLLALSSCGGGIPEFSLKVKTTPKLIGEEAKPIDLSSIVSGGPLYVFDEDSANPTLAAYRKLRAARAEEMITLMRQELALLDKALGAMPDYRARIVAFAGNLADLLAQPQNAEQAKLAAYARDTLDKVLLGTVKTTDASAKLVSLAEAMNGLSDEERASGGAAAAMFRYQEYLQLSRLLDAIANELTLPAARAGGFIMVIRGNDTAYPKAVRKLAKKYDKRIGKAMRKVQERLLEALAVHLDLAAGFESLSAADYAFTMATLAFAGDVLPRAARQANQIPTNELVSDDDRAFAQTYARFLQRWTGEMQAGMEAVEEPVFLRDLTVARGLIPPFVGTAHAGVGDWLDKAAGSLTSTITGAGEKLYGAAKGAASGAYKVANAVTEATGAKAVFRKGQQGLGVAVDSVSLFTGGVALEAAGLYYGNTRQDLNKMHVERIEGIYKAWDEDRYGAATFKETYDTLDAVEKGVGKVTSGIVEKTFDAADWTAKKATGGYVQKVWGRDTTSWAAGKLGEITAGMATGFGKGVANLSNVDSGPEKILEGTIDVAFSFIGGSKSVVKGSQAFKGTKELGENLMEAGLKQTERLALKLENQALKGSADDIMKKAVEEISGKEIKILSDNTRRIMENEMKEKVLKEQQRGIAKILDNLAAKADAKVLGNLKDAGEGAKKFVSEGFELSVKGIKEASGEVFGKTMKEYADNVVGSVADNFIKEMALGTLGFAASPEERAAIAKADAQGENAQLLGMLAPDNQAAAEAIREIGKILAETGEKLAAVKEEAKVQSEAIVKEEVKAKIAEKAIAEADKRLTTPVRATGSFSGDYRGSVSMMLTPGGGPVSGTVSTKYGAATISGSVSNKGSLAASVSGGMTYDYYPDGKTLEKRHCTLSASMSGSVKGRHASGTYSGSCAKENDSGSWSASW